VSWQKSWATIFSGQRNRIKQFSGSNWSYRSQECSEWRSANSCFWENRYEHLKGAKTINNLLAWIFTLSLHPYYSSSRESFRSHFGHNHDCVLICGKIVRVAVICVRITIMMIWGRLVRHGMNWVRVPMISAKMIYAGVISARLVWAKIV